MVADRDTHSRQRRLLSHAFSEKALREQESLLQMHISKLIEQLASRAGVDDVDLVSWLNFLSRHIRRAIVHGWADFPAQHLIL